MYLDPSVSSSSPLGVELKKEHSQKITNNKQNISFSALICICFTLSVFFATSLAHLTNI